MWAIKPKLKNNRGDTLVEVLVCIAIVSVILAGAFVVTHHSRQGVENSQEHAKAMKLLESQIEQLRSVANSADADQVFTHPGTFCMFNGAVVDGSSTNCSINNSEPIYHLSITRDGSGSNGAVFTANAHWAQITGGFANEQLSYRLYNGS